MEYFFLHYKKPPSFYKSLANICAISRCHHVELEAAAMAQIVKKQRQHVAGLAL
jgi:hypothetical protein